VVPLRAGGGTRLKILEAWAAGLPVVSTTIGAAGLDGKNGEHLALADTPQAMAEVVARLLQDPQWACALARSARRLAEERYDWPAIAAGLSNLLGDVTQRKKAVS
jgi:glycosyltransferase involved in cell wall biosynthesis